MNTIQLTDDQIRTLKSAMLCLYDRNSELIRDVEINPDIIVDYDSIKQQQKDIEKVENILDEIIADWLF